MFMTDYDRAMETRSPEVIKRTKTNNILKMVGDRWLAFWHML